VDKIIIQGGRRLEGEVAVSGSKNAALPILISSLLTSEPCVYQGIPQLVDINTALKLLAGLGVVVDKESWVKGGGDIILRPDRVRNFEASYDLVRTMRASFLVLGPLLARFGYAHVSTPGGCAIGTRPVNLHLKGLAEMGATIEQVHGYVEAKAKKLRGAQIYLDLPSVGATENLMMAASLAEGTTVIENAAKEPEIEDLAAVLNQMGARVEGAGGDLIRVEGVSSLGGLTHRVIPDRIEAASFVIAGALIGVRVKGNNTIKSVDVTTLPYPGFPTDMQAQMMVLMSVADGVSVITETIFENRFMHAQELDRMGADIRLEGNRAVVRGVKELSGAPVMATDLRASVSLVLAGLVANGTTEVSRVYHLDRGYEHIEKKFSKLGAAIERVKG